MLRTIALVVLAAAAVAAQEHSYTQADIENGARLYQSSCAGCHGPNGDMVPGIELQRGQFRRGSSDVDLIRIIQGGIAGTTMPPSSFTDSQAGSIVAYLRSVAPASAVPENPFARGGPVTIARGSAARGETLYNGKGVCATCHRVNGSGPRVAPDLTEIGTIRPAPELHQKLVDPSANIRPGNRYVEAVTKRGDKIAGRLLNQDTFTVQLLDGNERLLSLSRADLRDFSYVKNSPMPSYRDKLTQGELDDLVAYLVSLKGFRP
jgi:putative heme-binding domain-containing protein